MGPVIVGCNDAAVAGRASEAVSSPVAWPSSASSVISSSFRREDPLEEQLDGAAVCREQAAARAASLSSSAEVIETVVSCGVNFSETAVKWTATRAIV